MADFEIVAQTRTDFGKGAIRRLRREGQVPGVIYGTEKEPQALQIAEHYLRKQLENEAVFAHILTVNIDGNSEQAVIKDLQRHPATSRVTHMDFLRVSATQSITMQVPLHFENESEAPGVRQGGSATHLVQEVEISCLPKDLPEFIAVDMAGLDLGDAIMLSQLTVPAGVELTALMQDNDQTVATVQMVREATEEEVDGDAAEAAPEADSGDAPEVDEDGEE